MKHRFPIRVYYEDTDLAGVVYYANYLKFTERGRSEFLRELGIDQGKLKAEADFVFAVRKVDAEYLIPAKFDDDVEVVTEVSAVTGARIVLNQDIYRQSDLLFRSQVTIVAMNSGGAAARLPASIRATLTGKV